MVKMCGQTRLSITLNLGNLNKTQRNGFHLGIKDVTHECTKHNLSTDLDYKTGVLKIGPFPAQDLQFIQGAICGLANGMNVQIFIHDVDYSVEAPATK
jgi:hypothetical protein